MLFLIRAKCKWQSLAQDGMLPVRNVIQYCQYNDNVALGGVIVRIMPKMESSPPVLSFIASKFCLYGALFDCFYILTREYK
jgi:hypothetical protein